MRTKLVNKDPFSNATELMMFEANNCDLCIKASLPRPDGTYTNADSNNLPNRCAIQRDIITRIFTDYPIAQRTLDVCTNYIIKGTQCPYLQMTRNKPRQAEPTEQTKLF